MAAAAAAARPGPEKAARAAQGFACGVEIRESPGKGLGLFATAAVAAGARVWSYDPAVLTEYTAEAEAAAFLEALPSDAARREVLVHVYCWGGNCIDISRSNTKYTNHSSSPNTGSNPNGEDDCHTYALRDIACGEEITEDYGTYASPWAPGSSP